MTFERTGIREVEDDLALVRTSPRNETGTREYWFSRRGGAWVPTSEHVTAHAIQYARQKLDGAVLDRMLGDGQLQLTDFAQSVEDRGEVHAIACIKDSF